MGYHILSGILGALLAFSYPTQDSQVNKIMTEVMTILKKSQRPLLQQLTEEFSKNVDYVANAKPFGVENGVSKIVVACTALCCAYYGYKKYKEINSYSKNQDQKIKDDSSKKETMQ